MGTKIDVELDATFRKRAEDRDCGSHRTAGLVGVGEGSAVDRPELLNRLPQGCEVALLAALVQC